MNLFIKWGKWEDLIVGNYSGVYYVVQGRSHKSGEIDLKIRRSFFGLGIDVPLTLFDLKTLKS